MAAFASGEVALDAFEHEPARGRGAGTFALEWDRHRPTEYQIEDAHSLYFEIRGELGIIGLLLVTAAIILVLAGFAARARGPDRVAGGALFGAGLAWTVHAGVDWDWEMPVVTCWFFTAGGLALAARDGHEMRARGTDGTHPRRARLPCARRPPSAHLPVRPIAA
jgi:O-antigen ligase